MYQVFPEKTDSYLHWLHPVTLKRRKYFWLMIQ